MSSGPLENRARSARSQLILIALGLLLPAFAYSGFLIANFASAERVRYRQQVLDVARRTAAAVDRELAKDRQVVQVLATSPYLREGQLQKFYEQAAAAKRIIKAEIFVKDETGQHLVNTRFKWGESLPAALTLADRHALQTGETTTSDLFTSATANIPVIGMSTPSRLTGDKIGLVVLGLTPERMLEVLRLQLLPGEWTATIIDGNDTIIARSRLHEQFVGKIATANWRQNAKGIEGQWSGSSLERTPVISAYVRSQQASSWRIAVGIPQATLEAPLRRSLMSLVLLGLAMLAGALLTAGWYARRLTRGLSRLADDARLIGAGQMLSASPASIREIDAVTQALAKASVDLDERSKALQLNEQRLRLALEAGKMGAWDWDLTTGEVMLDEFGCKLWNVDPKPMPRQVGEFFPLVDSRDVQTLKSTLAQVIERRQSYHHDFRVRHGNGEVRWLTGRGLLLGDADGKPARMIGMNFDITESKRVDERQKLLVRELDHRVKNTLASVVTIIQRSREGATSIDDLMRAIEDRIQALAQAHSLLSRSGWKGVALAELIKGELEPYATAANASLEGPGIVLAPEATEVVTMVLHELVTNAGKYGALSTPGGRVSIRWDRCSGSPPSLLKMEWTETGGPPAGKPGSGYGLNVIRELIPYELKGTVNLEFRPEGAFCRITIPLGRAEAALQ